MAALQRIPLGEHDECNRPDQRGLELSKYRRRWILGLKDDLGRVGLYNKNNPFCDRRSDCPRLRECQRCGSGCNSQICCENDASKWSFNENSKKHPVLKLWARAHNLKDNEILAQENKIPPQQQEIRALEELPSNRSRTKACRRGIASATGHGGSNQGMRNL